MAPLPLLTWMKPREPLDVGDLEMDAFLKPESAGVNGYQAGAIDRKPDKTQNAADLVG